jgi:hypothetical protein
MRCLATKRHRLLGATHQTLKYDPVQRLTADEGSRIELRRLRALGFFRHRESQPALTPGGGALIGQGSILSAGRLSPFVEPDTDQRQAIGIDDPIGFLFVR